MVQRMETVSATTLKNHLGVVLARAALGPVAVERHGRVVAWLVPPDGPAVAPRRSRGPAARQGLRRHEEERLVALCASGDFRPSRWRRAGDQRTLAGLATMLASTEGFDRTRLLVLAEQLCPGMTAPEEFGRWLAQAPVQAARFLPMVRDRMKAWEHS
jgi:antitoxin (DNA-binding transcriptional repressor) of toxin-antitoxin stability system